MSVKFLIFLQPHWVVFKIILMTVYHSKLHFAKNRHKICIKLANLKGPWNEIQVLPEYFILFIFINKRSRRIKSQGAINSLNSLKFVVFSTPRVGLVVKSVSS